MIKMTMQFLTSKKNKNNNASENEPVCKIETVSDLNGFDLCEGQVERIRNSGRRHRVFGPASNND